MRRLKRENTLLHRIAQQNAVAYSKDHVLFMTVLAQLGGQATITTGTMNQVLANSGLRIITSQHPDRPAEVTLILTDGTEVAPSEPARLENGSTIEFGPSTDEDCVIGSIHSEMVLDQPSIESNEL